MPCLHSLRIGRLCADCGNSIQDSTKLYNALHSTDDLKITESLALEKDTIRVTNLRKERKLVLVLDLNQTILHTTISNDFKEDVDNFVLGGVTYNVKLRPNIHLFLSSIYKLYEIHVYTMGVQAYADKICRILDPEKKYFGDRVISRSVNNGEYVKNLNRLFCLHDNVIILDNRADVWNFSSNLILVKPYFYWKSGDINDPKMIKRVKK